MALSNALREALQEYASTLEEDHDHRSAVEKDIRRLRHADADGLASYEDAAYGVISRLYNSEVVAAMHVVSDQGEGAETLGVKPE